MADRTETPTEAGSHWTAPPVTMTQSCRSALKPGPRGHHTAPPTRGPDPYTSAPPREPRPALNSSLAAE